MKRKKYDVGRFVALVEGWEDSFLLFNNSFVKELEGARVFDVGQGDCIGLRDQEDRVFCYIDYGGLADHPDKTDPKNTRGRLDVSGVDGFGASIILTHWDKDHYWSGTKNAEATRVPWLVPRQHVCLTAAKFASSLPEARCWPESLGSQTLAFYVGNTCRIEIRKCQGFDAKAVDVDTNISGLAVTLVKGRVGDTCQVIILPGDCPFDKIPNLPKGRIVGALAYHHGSKNHWFPRTAKVLIDGGTHMQLIYSYGRNSWGFPHTESYDAVCVECNWEASDTPRARALGRQWIDLRWHNLPGW
jgi:hypothetical protein